jgi:hypothetical protein
MPEMGGEGVTLVVEFRLLREEGSPVNRVGVLAVRDGGRFVF